MRIDWLKPLIGRPGPFATVYIDATPSAESTGREVEGRWRALRRDLHRAGAPGATLDALEDAVLRPTRVAGPHGRVLIVAGQDVLVDRVLREPPAVTHGLWGPVPSLWEAVRSASEAVDHVVVVIDRQGADLRWAGGDRGRVVQTIEGGHDDIQKVHGAGMSRSRIEARAEDSWERNAEAVAEELDRQVLAHRPELVVLSGDVRAVALVRGALGRSAASLVVEVPGGGRAAGIHEAAFEARVSGALDDFRARRRDVALAEFRQRRGQEMGAVTALDDVVSVLRRGQVAELLLAEDGLDGRSLWIGSDPLQLAARRDGLGDATAVEELPATAALVRAALGQDAGLTLVPRDGTELIDGVGAILRWADSATPAEVAATMSGDNVRLSVAR